MHLLKAILLLVFDKKIDKQKLTEAIKLTNLGDFIKGQPSGINTFVGNDGIKISGGERQHSYSKSNL